MGRVEAAGGARPTRLRRRRRARRRQSRRHPTERRGCRRDARRARRDHLLGRRRRRSEHLRGGAASRDGHASGTPRRRRDGAATGRSRARHAGARDLPRLPAPQRRPGRGPDSAPPRGGRPRRAQGDPWRVLGASGRGEAGDAARVRHRRSLRSHVASPPGARSAGRGARRDGMAADGTLEGVEDPSRRFTVGVQWHPEAGEDAVLFEALVEEARDYRTARRPGS